MIDNREALAYVIFRYAGVERDVALAIVDEQAKLVRPLERALLKKWRPRRKRGAGKGEG